MRPILAVISALIGIIGLVFIVRGCIHPNSYKKELSKENTTAVRVTQVYTEATHFVVTGIGIVSFGILISFISIMVSWEEVTNLLSRLTRRSEKPSNSNKKTDDHQPEENES